MTLLVDASRAKRFDVRVLETNLQRGIIKSDDLEKELQGLPDDSENAGWTDIDVLAADNTDSN